MSREQPGRKVGKLHVKLDRKKDRYNHAEVTMDLRLDAYTGMFYAEWEGTLYKDATKEGLSKQIKAVVTKSIEMTWTRYLVISYEAEQYFVEDERTGRPASQGQYRTLDIDDDRDKHVDRLTYSDPDDAKRTMATCGIKLQWSLRDVSDPYSLPEDRKKIVRSIRDVEQWSYGSSKGKRIEGERIGNPTEWDDAKIPTGYVPWTVEREALLRDIVNAIGQLDRRMADLLNGAPEDLAKKLDAAAQTDPSRLLAAPPEAPKKRGKS
jgi:hypothetical protein